MKPKTAHRSSTHPLTAYQTATSLSTIRKCRAAVCGFTDPPAPPLSLHGQAHPTTGPRCIECCAISLPLTSPETVTASAGWPTAHKHTLVECTNMLQHSTRHSTAHHTSHLHLALRSLQTCMPSLCSRFACCTFVCFHKFGLTCVCFRHSYSRTTPWLSTDCVYCAPRHHVYS